MNEYVLDVNNINQQNKQKLIIDVDVKLIRRVHVYHSVSVISTGQSLSTDSQMMIS